jgi:hypothetical protein
MFCIRRSTIVCLVAISLLAAANRSAQAVIWIGKYLRYLRVIAGVRLACDFTWNCLE